MSLDKSSEIISWKGGKRRNGRAAGMRAGLFGSKTLTQQKNGSKMTPI